MPLPGQGHRGGASRQVKDGLNFPKNIEFLIQKNIRCPFLHKAEGAPKDDDKKVEDDKKSNKVVREVSEATKEDVIGVVEDKKSKKNITMKQVK